MGMLGMHGSYATNMKTQECDVLVLPSVMDKTKTCLGIVLSETG